MQLARLCAKLICRRQYNELIRLLYSLDAQTFLERVKTVFSDTPGLPPEKIHATIGQNSESHNLSRFSWTD